MERGLSAWPLPDFGEHYLTALKINPIPKCLKKLKTFLFKEAFY